MLQDEGRAVAWLLLEPEDVVVLDLATLQRALQDSSGALGM